MPDTDNPGEHQHRVTGREIEGESAGRGKVFRVVKTARGFFGVVEVAMLSGSGSSM